MTQALAFKADYQPSTSFAAAQELQGLAAVLVIRHDTSKSKVSERAIRKSEASTPPLAPLFFNHVKLNQARFVSTDFITRNARRLDRVPS